MLSSPGHNFKKYIAQREKLHPRRITSKRRRLFLPKSKPDTNYGPNAQEADEPINEIQIKEACLLKLPDFQNTKEEIKEIELMTIGQQDNDIYLSYRSDRLTASQFGMVSVLSFFSLSR